jgi:two-component system, response regulator PdtaR
MTKIMVVEDEVLSAMIMCKTLENRGYAVCKPVATGEEAVVSAIAEKPDLIFMDICLAGEKDGIQAAREIGEIYNIPIIFVTAYSDTDVKKRAERLNPAGYMNKPVGIDQMQSAIEAVLSGVLK